MAVFNKKTTLVHHITYMGIMAAINFIFVLLATFIPAFMFLLILILPFASTIVSYYCLKKYYIIYAVASVVLCLITGNFADTIFYVVPAIITGFVIGVLLGKKINPFWLILVSSLIESLLTFAFIPLINLIIHDDIVALFLNAFRITNFAYKTELTYLFVYFISLLQCSLSHFIMFTDSKKIGIEINTCIPSFIPFIIGDELCIALCFVFAFFYTPIAFVMAAISIYFSIFLLIDILSSKRKLTYIILVVLLFAAFFCFGAFYSMLIKPLGMLLIVLFSIAISITSFINNHLLNR